MYFALGIGDVPGIINNALRSLTAWLCEIIYTAIAGAYQLFMELGLLTFDENLTAIYNKISLIIGIFMVFRVIFWLIELLVSPDKISDKEKNPGKIVSKVLISVILLAMTPRIFELAFRFQYQIISKNIIARVIAIDDVEDYDATSAGRIMAAELFVNFYTANTMKGGTKDKLCSLYAPSSEDKGYYYNHLIQYGKLENLSNKCLVKTDDTIPDSTDNVNPEEGYVIDFNGLFAVGVGAVVLWMIIMYCISLGARYVQLIFLQVIAPIPIMCYLTPNKDSMFSKWLKQCTTTYLDIFIRMAIISFVMLLSMLILSNENNIISNMANSSVSIWIKIFLVLGLLTFAKKAPDLIQELLPKSVTKASGDFGLSFKKRAENMVFGKHIAKGYDKAVGFLGNTAKSAALLPLTTAKKTITGIDSAKHGKGFWNGFNKNPGKAMQWINKQRETFTPEAYKASKERIEGRENVNAIRVKWNDGVKVAEKLINAGVSDWQGALDGKTHKNYKTIFKNDKFINSKMAVDRASKNEETYRLTQQEISMAKATGKKLGIRKLNIIGESAPREYNLDTEQGRLDFSKDYEKQQKILKGAEEVHAEISKQYQDDAATEKQFKFIKGNEVNPTNQSEDHTSRGIKTLESGSGSGSGSGSTTPGGSSDSSSDDDIYILEQDIEDAYDKLYELTGNGASQEEIDEQLNRINDITKKNESNLEDEYRKLYELTSSGASQEEIDAQIKKINDIKSGEIK